MKHRSAHEETGKKNIQISAAVVKNRKSFGFIMRKSGKGEIKTENADQKTPALPFLAVVR